MLAELVEHVIGVDPDLDWITVAAVDARTSGVIATDRFPASGSGYRDVRLWADAYSIVGHGSSGRRPASEPQDRGVPDQAHQG